LDEWIKATQTDGIEAFRSAANSIRWNKESILNFFDNQSTDSSAESFKALLNCSEPVKKALGYHVFLFRLTKLFA
jgi:transposase